jgi:hypothetical protein
MVGKENDMPIPRRLNLLDKTVAGTETHLDILISDTDDLVMEGQDLGDAPERFFDDEDYEYWVTVRREYKDWLLLNLIKEYFASESSPSSAFMEWLKKKKKGIPYEFFSY